MDFWASFLEFVGRLWASLSGALGGEALALLVVAVIVVALTVIWRVHAAIIATEFYKKNKALWELVDDRIADLVFLISIGDVDLTEYIEKSQERVEEGLPYVDPRMLYLLDRVEAWVNETLHVSLDFETLLARAERIFNEIKNDPTNSVGDGGVVVVEQAEDVDVNL